MLSHEAGLRDPAPALRRYEPGEVDKACEALKRVGQGCAVIEFLQQLEKRALSEDVDLPRQMAKANVWKGLHLALQKWSAALPVWQRCFIYPGAKSGNTHRPVRLVRAGFCSGARGCFLTASRRADRRADGRTARLPGA